MDGIERFKGPRGRYYQLWVQRDLFGSLVIMRAWGGQRSGRGGFMAKSLASDMECQMELKRIRADAASGDTLRCETRVGVELLHGWPL